MTVLIRPTATAHSMFFTVALAARGDDLLLREIEHLRQAVRMTRFERPFVIEAWVVLPDHLHAIWTLPPGDDDYATRWRLIKSRFSAALPKIMRQNRGLWHQRSWQHPLCDPEDHAAHMRFCRMDPVHHGLVLDPGAWRFSSFNQAPRLQSAG